MVEENLGRVNRERAEKAQNEFAEAFAFKEPWSNYVNVVGLTKRFMVEWIKNGQKGSPESVKDSLAKLGRDPDEWTISVGLRRTLPDDLVIPSEYKGIPVNIDVIGEITLASK